MKMFRSRRTILEQYDRYFKRLITNRTGAKVLNKKSALLSALSFGSKVKITNSSRDLLSPLIAVRENVEILAKFYNVS